MWFIEYYWLIVILALTLVPAAILSVWRMEGFVWRNRDTIKLLFCMVGSFIPLLNAGMVVVTVLLSIISAVHYITDRMEYTFVELVISSLTRFINRRLLNRHGD